MIRQFLHAAANFLFKLLSRVEPVGMENLPPQGGCIIASNHLSRIDPVLVFALGKRRDMSALVADKYKRNFLIRPLIVGVGGIWINREEADIQALREARQFLRNGGMLGIAPEGTRSRTGALDPGQDRGGVPCRQGRGAGGPGGGVRIRNSRTPALPLPPAGDPNRVWQAFHPRAGKPPHARR